MSEHDHDAIARAADALRAASAGSRQWLRRVARAATAVANEEQSLVEETLRAENLARKVAASSGRRDAAGVFGPSQAGKSYLVSVLGRRRGGELEADFAGTRRNFIREINPEGGKEATGLVTRFTVAQGTRDAEYPVELRLLSETDLVKILGNSFMSDFDHHKRTLTLPKEEAIREALATLEGAATASGSGHLDEVAMFDIGEYFRANFATTIEPLSRAGYWEALARFGHRLAPRDRTSLYSLIWGCTRELTEVFESLFRVLEELRHAGQVRATMDCLLPRQHSIIDVETLKQRLGTPEDARDLLAVVPDRPGARGPKVSVTRATLCALVAELKIVMADRPWSFFEHTDVLDFPGARAREQLVDLPFDAKEKAVTVRNMLLRGKIAYLFQRYTDDRELPCILLCMPPGNQEVKDLTALVRRWVHQTHGDHPKARAGAACALFFVLTKLDEDLRGKPGDTPESVRSRLETRLEASMNQLFKQESWLQDWDGRPFGSTYFLRNPGFLLEEVFTYGSPGASSAERVETGIAASASERLRMFREGMLELPTCKRHFSGGTRSLDAALEPNDGGVSYLVEQLERVLLPGLKTGQLRRRLREQASQLDARLRRLYRAEDDDSRRQKEGQLKEMRAGLAKAVAPTQFRTFFRWLEMVALPEDEAKAIFLNVAALKLDALPKARAGEAESTASTSPSSDPWADLLAAEGAAAGERPPAPAPAEDRFDVYASQAINRWVERVRSASSDPAALRLIGLDAALVNDLGNELVVGAHRTALVQRIADKVRRKSASANLRWEDVATSAGCIASIAINDYVAYLGYGELPEDERPGFPEPPAARQRAVFAAPPLPRPGEPPALEATRKPLERDYFVQWGTAFTSFGISNAQHAGGRDIDEEDNAALGAILLVLGEARA